jgi:hypothetical protein
MFQYLKDTSQLYTGKQKIKMVINSNQSFSTQYSERKNSTNWIPFPNEHLLRTKHRRQGNKTSMHAEIYGQTNAWVRTQETRKKIMLFSLNSPQQRNQQSRFISTGRVYEVKKKKLTSALSHVRSPAGVALKISKMKWSRPKNEHVTLEMSFLKLASCPLISSRGMRHT